VDPSAPNTNVCSSDKTAVTKHNATDAEPTLIVLPVPLLGKDILIRFLGIAEMLISSKLYLRYFAFM